MLIGLFGVDDDVFWPTRVEIFEVDGDRLEPV